MALCFANGDYAGEKLKSQLKKIGKWTLEIIKRSDKTKASEIQSRWWVVERTFAKQGDAAGWL